MFARKTIARIVSNLFVVPFILAVPTFQMDEAAAAVLYAEPDGSGDCSSWEDACSLQTALTDAVSGDEIWVAAGTYKPTTGTDRNATFQLKDGVAVYGGFAGTETRLDQRDPAVHVTILSGDIDNNDSQTPIITDLTTVTGNTTNSYHVVTGSGVSENTVLDGFTITAGQANGPGDVECNGPNCGGGMYNDNSSPTLTNITFSGNSAEHFGGGMYNENSSPTLNTVTFRNNTCVAGDGGGMFNLESSPALTNVAFDDNRAKFFGGGMGNQPNNHSTLTDVTFSGNQATLGGGMSNRDSSHPTLINVTFNDNLGYDQGGGMYNFNSSNPTLTNVVFSGNQSGAGGGMNNYAGCSPSLTNVTFSDNQANSGGGMYNNYSDVVLTQVLFSGNKGVNGGAMHNFSSSVTMTNITIAGNLATEKGGGIYNDGSGPYIKNTLIWGNQSGSGGDNLFNSEFSSPNIRYSLVEPCNPGGVWDSACGTDGGNNRADADPLFVAPEPSSNAPTTAGNYHLRDDSPAINIGDNAADLDGTGPLTATIRSITEDLDGNPRFVGVFVDLGAYENQTFACPAGGVLFVDQDATGLQTGASWTNALITLQDALQVSAACEIWVADGVYYPDEGGSQADNDRFATFQLKDDVMLYGGFTGKETAHSQRNPAANLTILSGDLLGNDNDNVIYTEATRADNSYHVVTGADNASLDGFTITAGHANGAANTPAECGGGMYNGSSSPTLTNVTFSSNTAMEGGGMCNFPGSPTLTGVTFSGNSVDKDYGNGGGMINWGGDQTLTNVTFSGNSAYSGGGMFNWTSNQTLTNVTFSGNLAWGSGMFNAYSNTIILDSILWDNGDQIYNANTYSTVVSDSVIKGGCPVGSTCTHYITTDPILGALGNHGGPTQTIPLLPGSSAINSGNGTYCPANDQRGMARVGTCDIGAFESQGFTLTKSSGDSQSTSVDTAFPDPLALTVIANAAGEPVNGGTITFSAPASGASAIITGSPAAISAGHAQVTASANDILGSFNVNANTPGATSGVDFALQNTCAGSRLTVTNSNDDGSGSLRRAIANICPGGTIDFANNYTILLTSQLEIDQNMTIDAGVHAVTVSGDTDNDGTGNVRVFNVGVHTFNLNNLIVTRGYDNSIYNNGTLIITNSTFSNNLSASYGGGIANYATLSITNSTFYNNTTTMGGSVVYNQGITTITNSTLSGNTGGTYGGAIYTLSGSVKLRNTIIANSSSGDNCTGTITDGGGNLVWGDTTCPGINADPRLGTPGDNGGFTQTIPLLAHSSAIDTGNDAVCPSSDQRGVSRPRGAHCDIGAYEYIDTTAPTVDIFTLTTPSNSLAIPITIFSVSDDVSVTGYMITTSAAAPTAGSVGWTGTAPATYTVASDGSYTLYPWAKDATGNVSAVFTSPRTVVVDTTAPVVTSFTVTTPSNSLAIPITTFEATDAVGVTGYLITTTATPPSAGATGWTGSASLTYPVASDGSYTLHPWAKDATGNVSAVFGSPRTVVVDTTAPVVTAFTLTTPSNSLSIPITTFEATDADGVTGYLITTSATVPTAGAAGWTGNAPLTYPASSDGSYTLYPWAKDAAGNVSAIFASPRTVVVDTTKPVVTVFTLTTPSNSLSIPITTFEATDANGVTGYLITESSTPPAPGAAGWTGSPPLTYTVALDGSTTLYPWARDAAGNVSAIFASPRTVVVDTTAPVVTEFTLTTPSNNLSIPITAFEATDAVGVTGYLMTTTATPPSAGAAGWTGSASLTYPVASDGSYTLYPWAKDAAGNVSAVFISPRTVVVDTTKPVVTSFTVTTPSNSLSIPITSFSVTDAVGVTGYLITTSATPPSAGAAGWTGIPPTTYSVVADGSYTLYPWAKDAAGNVSAVFSSPRTVVVDTTKPDTQIDTHPTNPTNSADASFSFSSPDGTATFECTLDSGSFAPCTSPKDYTGLPAGSHTFTVRAKDPAGNVDATPAVYTWAIDLGAPTLVSSVRSNPSPTYAHSVNFTVTFSESVTGVDKDDFSVTTTGVSGAFVSGVSGSGSVYTVTVNTGSGNGTIRLDIPESVSITDLAGNLLSNLPYTGGETYTVSKVFIFLPLIMR